MSPVLDRPRNREEGDVAAVRRPVPARKGWLWTLVRYLRRTTAFVVLALALFALWVIVSPVLPSRYAFPPLRSGSGTQPQASAPAAGATTALPARPADAPARIPGWAWSLHKWLSTPPPQRGARPAAAPRHVPNWFWDWRKWRLKLAQQ